MKRGSSRDPWGVRDERKAPAVCSEARENTEDGSSATAPQPGRLRREGHLLIHPPHAPRRVERPHGRREARLKSPVAPYRTPKAKVRYCVAGHLKSSATPRPAVSDTKEEGPVSRTPSSICLSQSCSAAGASAAFVASAAAVSAASLAASAAA